MVRNVHNQKNDCGVGWGQQPTTLGSITLEQVSLWTTISQFKYSKQSDTLSVAYSTKCLSGSFIAGVKIEITTNGSLPVFFTVWTLPMGLK